MQSGGKAVAMANAVIEERLAKELVSADVVRL
jgi:hypothetical protein